jgi:hypothetical protein
MGSFRHVAPPQTVMSSSTTKDSSSYSSLWNEDAAPVTFHSLPVKPKSPFQRRQVVTFVILLCVITLSICYFTAWILPSPTSTKPWQLKTNRACTRSILGKDLVTDEQGANPFSKPHLRFLSLRLGQNTHGGHDGHWLLTFSPTARTLLIPI